MPTASLLIVEDDVHLRGMLARCLGEEGFDVNVADCGQEAMRLAESADPALLIIDIALPDADGRDVCQALRARGLDAPILFLTARATVGDKVSGFNAGGDDYLTKPFALSELVVRLHALARRRAPAAAGAAFEIDPLTYTVTHGGVQVPLTPIEFRLVATLAAAAGTNVPRRKLVEAAWARGASVSDNNLDVYIGRLRRKLSDLPGAPCIVTAIGVGYSMR